MIINASNRHESMNCLRNRQNGGGKLMIWSRISYDGVGPLIFLLGTLNDQGYKDILKNHVLDHCLAKMDENLGVHLFMDDGAAPHTCRLVEDYCINIALVALINFTY